MKLFGWKTRDSLWYRASNRQRVLTCGTVDFTQCVGKLFRRVDARTVQCCTCHTTTSVQKHWFIKSAETARAWMSAENDEEREDVVMDAPWYIFVKWDLTRPALLHLAADALA